MKFLAFSALTFLVSSAACSPLRQRQTASPPSIPSDKLPSYSHAVELTIPFPIHESCNITLRRQLEHALDETAQLAYYAKRHLLLHGLDSPFVNKYFGNHSTATAVGWYDRILSASKFDVLFRCDDPDKNCATQDGMSPPSFLKSHISQNLPLMIATERLGGSLARLQRYAGDGHLSLVVFPASSSRLGLWAWPYRGRVSAQHFLGHRSDAPHFSRPPGERRGGGPFCR